MAHRSGYGGSVNFTSPESSTEYAPNTTTAMKVLAWSCDQRTKNFQAYAKSEDFVVTFGTVSEWIATIEFLVQDTANTDALEVRMASATPKILTSFSLRMDTSDRLAGSGILTRLQVNDPLDGPVTATCEVAGNGMLAGAAS